MQHRNSKENHSTFVSNPMCYSQMLLGNLTSWLSPVSHGDYSYSSLLSFWFLPYYCFFSLRKYSCFCFIGEKKRPYCISPTPFKKHIFPTSNPALLYIKYTYVHVHRIPVNVSSSQPISAFYSPFSVKGITYPAFLELTSTFIFWFNYDCLYWLPTAAVTNVHKFRALKQHKFILLQFWT